MFSALVGLAIGLQTIPERLQCPADHKGRKRVANSSESFRHMLQAAGYPQQRTHRIAACRRIHDILQIVDEGGVLGRFFFASSADPTNASGRRRIGFQFGNPAIDRATRDTRCLLDYIGPSKAVRARLSRHEKSPSSFVENRQHIDVSLSDGLDYVEGANHPRTLTRPIKAVNPKMSPDRPSQNPSPFTI